MKMLLAASFSLFLPSLSPGEQVNKMEKLVQKDIIPASCLASSKTTDGVAAFEALLQQKPFLEKNDVCYEITPSFIKENSNYKVFKYVLSCASFLLYKNKVHQLGAYFGGFGIVDARLADLNHDGKDEFYFTFSWGSGLHRSQAGYFDPVHEKVIFFEFAHLNRDLVFRKTDQDGIYLYDWDTADRYKFKARLFPAARISFVKGKILLVSWEANVSNQHCLSPE